MLAGSRPDVPRLLAAMDVFALTSQMEANPLSILEAMSVGRPVVATNVGSIHEAVVEAQTGFLVPAWRRVAIRKSSDPPVKRTHPKPRDGRRGSQAACRALVDRGNGVRLRTAHRVDIRAKNTGQHELGASYVSDHAAARVDSDCEKAARQPIISSAQWFTAARSAMLTELLLTTLARFLSGASVRWIDCQPDTCQRVYFANHTSHLDMILIWSALPHDVRRLTRPVAAKDYWDRGPIRRYMAKTYNALLVDRKEIKVHQSPVDVMLREIGSTDSLIIFPEGGRTAGETVGEFKSGLYYLSKKRPDLELVPVHIDNMNRVLPRGEFLPVPLLSCITFGPPMWLEAGETKDRFSNAGS